jgi:hypothetical protein
MGATYYRKGKTNFMRALFPLLVLITLPTTSALAQQSAADAMSAFVQGRYHLIGKAMDSDRTYHGTVVLAYDGDGLTVRRDIGGKTVLGVAAVEVSGEDATPVLRIRFTDSDEPYEETCMVSGDLDNYARITCYLYRPGLSTDAPGLEAMFIDLTN